MRLALLALLLAGCATARPHTSQVEDSNGRALPYLDPSRGERCRDPSRPCSLSYDFEPSGAAIDVFASADQQPRLLVLNEDGLLFHWSISPKTPWDHDNVTFARSLDHVLRKGESATSAVCDGVPVVLVASNFMPGRSGPHPFRERVVALAGSLDAEPRVLHRLSTAIRQVAEREGVAWAKVEGIALADDCRTLHVGFRSFHDEELTQEDFVDLVHTFDLDIDWVGDREKVEHRDSHRIGWSDTCSGHEEGISELEAHPDGSLLVLSSYERETRPRNRPEDAPEGELGGSLWRVRGQGEPERIACFPGHKPEALVVLPDGKSVRVLMEDDDYGGRPIRAYGVAVELP